MNDEGRMTNVASIGNAPHGPPSSVSGQTEPDVELCTTPGVGPRVVGVALVSRHGFSARYDVDRERGVFSREAHDLHGQSLVGRVLVCDTAKGGIATSWMLLDMVQRGVAPLAILFRTTNPVMVQGAVLAGLPMLHRLAPDPIETIRTGDTVEVDPAAGTVRVRRSA
jgi:uncharacterized protein